MTTRRDEKSPCIYVSACRDCSGLLEAVSVHLYSGCEIKVEDVVGVRVTEDRIYLQTRLGLQEASLALKPTTPAAGAVLRPICLEPACRERVRTLAKRIVIRGDSKISSRAVLPS